MPTPLNESAVRTAASSLGRMLEPEQTRQLTTYLGLLVKWNQRMNLVGPRDWPIILETLIQDSWHLADLLHAHVPQPQRTLDLGAGAGLPGIPLRMFWTSGEYFLVEPRHKRAIFMEQAVVSLSLPRTKVLCARMEALSTQQRLAGLIVSRAFKPWLALLNDVRAYLAPGGQVIIMSNAPRPDQDVPEYALRHVAQYAVGGKERFFWLFALNTDTQS